MPRGQGAEVGAVRIAKNGYQYVKVEDRGWVLKHWLVWEEAHGRKIDSRIDMVRFKDGDNTNFAVDNIIVIPKNNVSIRTRLARLYSQRDEVAAQIKYWEDELAKKVSEQAAVRQEKTSEIIE